MTDKELIDLAEKLDGIQQAMVSARGEAGKLFQRASDLHAQLSVISDDLQIAIHRLRELAARPKISLQ